MRSNSSTSGLAVCFCIALNLLLAACTGGNNKQPLEIGAHRGTLVVPPGWNVVNQGEKWEVRKGEASIVLHDLGPASPDAMQREAAHIMDLWRGNADGAQTRVKRLMPNVNRFVEEPYRTPVISTLLPLLENAAPGLPEAEVNQRFADWREALAALPTPSLDKLSAAALPVTGHDRRRDIQSNTQGIVGGKPAMDYMTVTQSTQDSKKRIVIVDNGGQLFAIYFGILGHEAHLDAFDRVVRSLHFDAAASDRR